MGIFYSKSSYYRPHPKVPTLAGGTYLGRVGIYLGWGRGSIPLVGVATYQGWGVPTFGGVPHWPGQDGIYPIPSRNGVARISLKNSLVCAETGGSTQSEFGVLGVITY